MEKVKFGTLKIGDQFSLNENFARLNIKVTPAVLLPPKSRMYNVIALSTGLPRTFRDEELVYLKHNNNAQS